MRAVGNFYIIQRQARSIVKIYISIMQAKNCQGAIVLQVHIAPVEAQILFGIDNRQQRIVGCAILHISAVIILHKLLPVAVLAEIIMRA